MSNEQKSLCWSCKHAVPKLVDGVYIKGCEWSIDGQPVPGWTAEKYKRNLERYTIKYRGLGYSYHVIKCPKFEKG